MSSKGQRVSKESRSSRPRSPRPKTKDREIQVHCLQAAATIQRARENPDSLTSSDIRHLQTTIGNDAVRQLLSQVSKNKNRAAVHRPASGKSSTVLPSFTQVGGSIPSSIQRQVPTVGTSVSKGGGLQVVVENPKIKTGALRYVVISNPRVTVVANPTNKNEIEERKPGTETSADFETGAKKTPKEGKTGIEVKLKAEIKKKYKNAVFTDAEGEAGPGGGSVALTVGGDWKNANVSVKFTLLSFGEEGKDIKITTATPSATVPGVILVDGMNFACKATIAFDVQPNSRRIGKWLLKKGVIRSLRGFGRMAGRIGAIPFLFVQAGYETLWAAAKNIKMGKEIPAFCNSAQALADEAGLGFIKGVFGGYSGLGALSGRDWFHKAYAVARADNPGMEEDQFKDALLRATEWRKDARGQISYQVKAAIYHGFVAKKGGDWNSRDKKLIREILFKNSGPAPSIDEGLGVRIPEIFKYKEQGPGYIELPEEEVRAKRVPSDLRGGVKHRVRNYELNGSMIFEGNGLRYYWSYNRSLKELIIYGGDQYEKIPFRP